MVQLPKLRIEVAQNRGVPVSRQKLSVPASRGQISPTVPLRGRLSGSTRMVQNLLDSRTRDETSRTEKHLHRRKSASRFQQGRSVRQTDVADFPAAGRCFRRSPLILSGRTSRFKSCLRVRRNETRRTHLRLQRGRVRECHRGQGRGRRGPRGRREGRQHRRIRGQVFVEEEKEQELMIPTIKKTFERN